MEFFILIVFKKFPTRSLKNLISFGNDGRLVSSHWFSLNVGELRGLTQSMPLSMKSRKRPIVPISVEERMDSFHISAF